MRRSGRPGLLAVFLRTARSSPAREDESSTAAQGSLRRRPEDGEPDAGSTIPARIHQLDVEGQEN